MGNKSGKKSSASNSIAETSRAHEQNVKNNPGISLGEAGGAQLNLQKNDLGVLGSLIDELSGFGQGMIGGNPIQKMMGAMFGMPVQVDSSNLGLSEMIKKLYPEEEATAAVTPKAYDPADPLAHLTPEQRAAVQGINFNRGFM